MNDEVVLDNWSLPPIYSKGRVGGGGVQTEGEGSATPFQQAWCWLHGTVASEDRAA